jgi:hypothetical protein
LQAGIFTAIRILIQQWPLPLAIPVVAAAADHPIKRLPKQHHTHTVCHIHHLLSHATMDGIRMTMMQQHHPPRPIPAAAAAAAAELFPIDRPTRQHQTVGFYITMQQHQPPRPISAAAAAVAEVFPIIRPPREHQTVVKLPQTVLLPPLSMATAAKATTMGGSRIMIQPRLQQQPPRPIPTAAAIKAVIQLSTFQSLTMAG